MSEALVIVESPSKAKTISKYLGKGYAVKASLGHVRDLPEKELGVDIENGFAPLYVPIKGKEKVLRELKAAANKADVILLAPDPDREGEAIAWHIAELLGVKNKLVQRVSFNEITKRAVLEAMEHPRELDINRFHSQQARRILDRLVGYKLSPLLWKKVQRGLSAGRVQSVAVRLVVEREEEIEAFRPEEFWELYVTLEADQPPAFVAKVTTHHGDKLKVAAADEAAAIRTALEAGRYVVNGVTQRQQKKRPFPPFITSTLQQTASRRLRMSPSNVMRVAQQLYEGVDINGDGPQGLITYMRTDSVRVSAEAQTAARELITRTYGKEFAPEQPNVYRSRAGAQEAHECIRPTNLELPPEKLRDKLTPPQLKTYELIWRRFLASQMTPATFLVTTVQIANGDYGLAASEHKETFAGHLAAMRDDDENGNGEEPEAKLPPLQESQELAGRQIDSQQKFTQPPPRFTEATLIKELEERGIGRPSTYAAILSTILDKNYVEKVKGAPKDETKTNADKQVKGGLRPTDLGRSVTRLLIASFPDVLNVSFTAWMETQLDEIEEGRADWRTLLTDFWGKFDQDLTRAASEMDNLKLQGELTDIPCDKCGKPMAIKYGRNGPFLACSDFPRCKNTKNFTRDENGRVTVAEQKISTQVCEKCGSPMIEKTGRYGPFLACSAYPKCKNIVSLKKGANRAEAIESNEKCPVCGGPMLLKVSHRGSRFHSCKRYPKCKGTLPYNTGVVCPREGCGGHLVEKSGPKGLFWSCSNYPACKTTFQGEPVAEVCPTCGHPFLLRRKRADAVMFNCPQKTCDYERVETAPVEPPAEAEG